MLGFFIVTLDAVVVNVTLPVIRADLGGGVSGLQWVVDGYTLMFAALLLSAGSLSDRVGRRRAFGSGWPLVTPCVCRVRAGPALGSLVAARFVQGAAAAAMMPASMALIRQAFPDPGARGRAIGVVGDGRLRRLLVRAGARRRPHPGRLAADLLPQRSAGAIALLLLARTRPSQPRVVPFDVTGQITGVLAMSGLTFGAIEARSHGFTYPAVIAAFAVAVLALAGFLRAEQIVRTPDDAAASCSAPAP